MSLAENIAVTGDSALPFAGSSLFTRLRGTIDADSRDFLNHKVHFDSFKVLIGAEWVPDLFPCVELADQIESFMGIRLSPDERVPLVAWRNPNVFCLLYPNVVVSLEGRRSPTLAFKGIKISSHMMRVSMQHVHITTVGGGDIEFYHFEDDNTNDVLAPVKKVMWDRKVDISGAHQFLPNGCHGCQASIGVPMCQLMDLGTRLPLPKCSHCDPEGGFPRASDLLALSSPLDEVD